MTAVAVPAGTHTFGPANGELLVKVYREGVASRMGHDLVLELRDWRITAIVDPADLSKSSVEASASVDSFSIKEATGGAKPLSRGDEADIKKIIREKILNAQRYPTIDFRSTGVPEVDATRYKLSGDLTVAGTTRPVDVDVRLDGSRARATFTVVQSQWGITPYKAFMGALKVRDAVDVVIEVSLPATR